MAIFVCLVLEYRELTERLMFKSVTQTTKKAFCSQKTHDRASCCIDALSYSTRCTDVVGSSSPTGPPGLSHAGSAASWSCRFLSQGVAACASSQRKWQETVFLV